MGDIGGGLLVAGGAVCLLVGAYVATYAFWIRNWEGWESWNRRTGLDGDRANEERLARGPHETR